MKEIKIALIGVGAHALKTVIPAINSCDGLKLVALVTRKRINRLDESLSHLAIYENIADLLSDNLVNAAYVASPVGVHYQQCKLLIEGGVHVLCEKKMCSDYKQTKELFLLAEKKGVLLQEALAYMHHPQFIKIKNYIKEAGENSLQFINAKFTVPSFDDDNIRYIPELGGGALNDVAIYPLSLFFALFDSEFLGKSSIVVNSISRGIDIKGQFFCKVGETILSAQWAFDTTYSNSIEFVFNDHKLVVNRAFSKPPSFDLPIIKESSYGVAENIAYQAVDQFELMLNEFVTVINASGQSPSREISLAVARLIEEISINVACN